jgi:fumarate hydratase subunit alpha
VIRLNLEDKLFNATIQLIEAAATWLPNDVENALKIAYEKETNPLAKNMLKAMIENVKVARDEVLPICQDTGTVIFYIKAGEKFPLLGKLPVILKRATIEATNKIPLRPNAVDVFTGKNSGDNTGRYIPWIEWEIEENSDIAEITVMLKGGGSEAPSLAKVIPPGQGLKGVIKIVLEDIFEAGAKPCPPVIVGVGLGPTGDIAMKLAKKALLRPIGMRSDNPEVAKFELQLLEAINSIGIGTHGMGGLTTALDVHVEYAYRHPAALAVAVATNCWAARKSTMKVYPDGKIEYLTHPYLNKEVK